MPTVAQLIQWAGPLHVELLAGHSGVAREIFRVVRCGVDLHDVPLQTGDMLLASLSEWKVLARGTGASLLEWIGELPVAAVLVSACEADTELSTSESCSTPVLLVSEPRLDEAEPVLTSWLSQSAARERRELQRLREDLSDASVVDVEGLVERVTQLTGKMVLLHDSSAAVKAICQPANRMRHHRQIDAGAAAASASLARRLHRGRLLALGPVYLELPTADLAMLAVPIRAATCRGAGTARCLSVVARPAEFTHRDRAVLTAAFEIVLDANAERDAAAFQQDPGECLPELVQLLLRGRTEHACVEAERVGYDLSQPCIGVAFGCATGATTSLGLLCGRLARVLGGRRALIRVEDNRVLCLVPAAECLANQWQRQQTLGSWQAELSRDVDGVCIGHSALHTGPRGARRALVEARQALAMSQRSGYPPGVNGYAGVWVRELLTNARAPEILVRLYDSLLRPLAAQDESHHHDLMRTLTVHLTTGGRTQQTADLLGVHRNSVLYRLQRVTELTGADLDDADTRLLLQLMLRTPDVVELSDRVRSFNFHQSMPSGDCTDVEVVRLQRE